jgi:hypothetical protein
MLGGLKVCNLFVSWERATTLISFYEASICYASLSWGLKEENRIGQIYLKDTQKNPRIVWKIIYVVDDNNMKSGLSRT